MDKTIKTIMIKTQNDIESAYEYLTENIGTKGMEVIITINDFVRLTTEIKTSDDVIEVRTYLLSNWTSGMTCITISYSFPTSYGQGWFAGLVIR